VGRARKLLNTAGFVVSAVLLIVLPTLTSAVLGTLAISVVLGGCATARGGFALNHLDVAPSFAGSVMYAARLSALVVPLHPSAPPSCASYSIPQDAHASLRVARSSVTFFTPCALQGEYLAGMRVAHMPNHPTAPRWGASSCRKAAPLLAPSLCALALSHWLP
jgi:hypothetical protein